MRVGVVLEQCLQRAPGGTGRYAYDLARALAQAGSVGDSVESWVAWHRNVDAARVSGVAGPNRLPLPERALALAWERGAGPAPGRADLIHAPTLLLPPRRRRTKLVVTIHDAVPWSHPETLTPRGVAFHRRMAERAERSADLVVVPTEAVRRELSAILTLGQRLVVVPPGLTPSLQTPPDLEARAQGLALPARFVLSAATLEPRKGLDLLVAAMASDSVPADVALVVVGQSGWGGIDPIDLAARAGLAHERLYVLGRVPDADLATCLARATVFAMPSRDEGFGLPVLEAMAAGVPVVCTDVPALVEVSGGAAMIVSPRADDLARAIKKLVSDASMRNSLIDRGRRRATAYDWGRSAIQLWQLYRAL